MMLRMARLIDETRYPLYPRGVNCGDHLKLIDWVREHQAGVNNFLITKFSIPIILKSLLNELKNDFDD
ncbi:hypothetical protein L8106_01957 [Lyngbya sp. PCC 8106]|nr:hypothetical protein L8106_01957 [Lyngbya sp. PCC 8106]